MSSLSQFTGGGGTIPGDYKILMDAPVSVATQGQEWLRSGNIKAYDASYAQAFATAPQLGVFGLDANTTLTNISSTVAGNLYYTGTNYTYVHPSGNAPVYSATPAGFASASATTGTGGSNAALYRNAVGFGNGYLVVPSAASAAPLYSTNGSAFTAVGGTWTTSDARNVVVYGGGGWIALGINANSTNYAYIANTNPTGAWTLTAATGILDTTNAGAYGAGTFVVCAGGYASATTRKLYTIASPGAAPVDRTANLPGIAAGDTLTGVVFTGTYFVVALNGGSTVRLLRSTDGVTWTNSATLETSALAYPIGTFTQQSTSPTLATDGAGTVVCCYGQRTLMLISRDHGATWGTSQVYAGKTGVTLGKSVSYTNGRWLAVLNAGGAVVAIVDVGAAIVTPDYMGQQLAYAASQYLRIK